MGVLTQEDIEFLRNLANELKTQDTGAQRRPVYIQVKEPIKLWGIDTDCADGVAIFIGDSISDGIPCFTVGEAKEDLMENYEIQEHRIAHLSTFDDVQEFCKEEDIDCRIGGYNNDERFHQFFLTFSAYEQHMRTNGHNYNHGSHSWLDSFFRNPQIERLIEIVEKFATVGDGGQ